MSTETQSALIEVTEEGVKAMRAALEDHGVPDYGLRVAIKGGGCSGYTYSMEPQEFSKENDTVLDFGGVKVFIDPMSGMLLKGTTIDFKKTLQGSGFVFKNPNAKRTCGCGHSFS